MDKEIKVQEPLLLAFSKYINQHFPELGGRVLPVSEAEINKTNVPTMPLCMLALTVAPLDYSVKSTNEISITDDFVVEFWFETNKVKRTDDSESPFWAFYNYEPLRNKFIAITTRWKSPAGFKVRIVSMEVETSDLAVMVTFRCQHVFDWCEPEELTIYLDGEPSVIGKTTKIKYSVCPMIETECCPEPACLEEENPKCP